MWKRIILGASLLGACTTGDEAHSLREGMSPAQVETVWGRPDGFQRAGDMVGYQYTNRLISGWGWDRADYYAVFKSDQLTAWGPGEVRQGHGPNGVLLFAPQ